MSDRNVRMWSIVGVAVVAVSVVAAGVFVPGIGLSGTPDASAPDASDAPSDTATQQESTATPTAVATDAAAATAEPTDTAATTDEQQDGPATATDAPAAPGNATVAGNESVYAPDWKTSARLDNATLRNMSKAELIERVNELQQVLNETQTQYLKQLRALQLQLNRADPGNVSNENATVTGEFPEAPGGNGTDGQSANGTTQTNTTDATVIRLEGRTSGWVGQSEGINGTVNPTLNLTAGQNYTVVWENADGVPHNFVLMNSQGSILLRTDIITEEGATQRVTFTATEAMDQYICEVHPSSMAGAVTTNATDSGDAAADVPDAVR